ncbi:MAG TPA: amidohydrolase family protein [Phycisphaerae bacterium]|nr:amidohydrolase family protein [Phycisphaerae bacterium]
MRRARRVGQTGSQTIVIVDCHTHVWESPEQLGRAHPASQHVKPQTAAMEPGDDAVPDASPDHHTRAAAPVNKSFVLAFKSRYLGAEIPVSFVAGYVRQHQDRLIGVAGIDPTNLNEALADMRRAHEQLGFKAITISPAAQDFHPADSRAMQVFAEAARLKMPAFVHQGFNLCTASKMEFGRPALLDEVAREFPQLKIVIAHMGYPWIEECIVLLGKHENVFADVSGLSRRPWQAYNALLSAYQYGVMDRLLFGSDFPFTSPTAAIESLYRLNQLATGTNLPTVPRPYLAGIVERDALALLGIEDVPAGVSRNDTGLLDGNEA